MKKIISLSIMFTLLMNTILCTSPVFAVEAQSPDTKTETSADTQQSASSQSDILSKDTMESASVDGQTGTSNEPVAETKSSEKMIDLIFTASGSRFENGEDRQTIQLASGANLSETQLPEVELGEAENFEGWLIDGKLYTEKELRTISFTQTTEIKAQLSEKKTQHPLSVSLPDSISGLLQAGDEKKLVLFPTPDGGTGYKTYEPNEAGMKNALFDIYQNKQDYTIYIGGDFSLGTSVTDNTVIPAPSASSMNFVTLNDPNITLTMVSSVSDPTDTTTASPADARKLNFGSDVFFGTNTVFRNISYDAASIYANGHDLTLAHGSYGGSAINLFMGTKNADLNASPRLTVNSTGNGVWNIYGGNNEGGTLNGDITLMINDASGTVTNLYGGGIKGNVNGNIQTTVDIQNPATQFKMDNYYGGSFSGNVSGTITNKIKGNGRWTSNADLFIGGSETGNIGTNRDQTAITTDIDTSSFSGGSADFIGANRLRGTITGSIHNTIKAGTNNKGSFESVSGGTGTNGDRLSQSKLGASDKTAYDQMTPDQRASLAEQNATFKVYGDITTNLLGGMMSGGVGENDYTRGAGFSGYIDGNTTITVGTKNPNGGAGGEGLVYSRTAVNRHTWDGDLSYISSTSTGASSTLRTYLDSYDIVGGGGDPGEPWSIYIKGKTKNIENNVLARWTYGGGFSGVIEGGSSIELNDGLVDTLEGGGYNGQRIYGDTSATMKNGEVDFFLSGGGWNDEKIVGNASAQVTGGVINCPIGGSYGASSTHTVDGNAAVLVKGGDFSGFPSHAGGIRGFSAGITNLGTLTGDAELTIDLREGNPFKLPKGISITGGRPDGRNTSLGTNEDNKITLNIYTGSGADVLNGATIYGDGGTLQDKTKSGSIVMNIDAPDSSIGSLAATQYSNISGGQILRNVTTNIQRVKSLNMISGGKKEDKFTDNIVNASTNGSIINVGTKVTSDEYETEQPIEILEDGIRNFTKLNIDHQTRLLAAGGSIVNGNGATAANHGSTYSTFGDVTITDGAELGVTSENSILSLGKLSLSGEAYLTSIPGKGMVNVSDVVMADDDTRLNWKKPTTSDESKMVDSNGTWFGNNKAFQVLTIDPDGKNAAKLTPMNFKGEETATGKTYIGDNEQNTSSSGYGIMLEGAVIDYQVIGTGLAEDTGAGSILHNVSEVINGNTPLPVKVWGTEVAGTKVSKGRLVIPKGAAVSPQLDFAPDQPSASWFYHGTIHSSEINSQDTTLSEQKDRKNVTWKVPDLTYSYQVKVNFTNVVKWDVHDAIITESEAKSLMDKEDVSAYNGLTDVPSVTNDADLTAIKEPIRTPGYKVHQISYQAGTNQQSKKTVHLIVVADSAVFPSNSRPFALLAYDATLTLTEANQLLNEEELGKNYTQAVVIQSDGTAKLPSMESAVFSEIKNVTADQLPKQFPVVYSFSDTTGNAAKTVIVQVSNGTLTLKEVPDDIDFGKQKTAVKTQTIWGKPTGSLVVNDSRGASKTEWHLAVKQVTPLTNHTISLADDLYYTDHKQSIQIGTSFVKVLDHTHVQDGDYSVSDNWNESSDGIKLQVPVEKQAAGEFNGTIEWQLQNTP